MQLHNIHVPCNLHGLYLKIRASLKINTVYYFFSEQELTLRNGDIFSNGDIYYTLSDEKQNIAYAASRALATKKLTTYNIGLSISKACNTYCTYRTIPSADSCFQ